MYIQITERCNMTCAHCCNSCTTEGEDMSLDTFRNAIKYDEYITLGGGEPTLHPLFWQLLGEAIAAGEWVWLATNGSMTDIALALAKMAKKNVIGCELSQDAYHDPIDGRVIQAFTKERVSSYGVSSDSPDARGIRDVTTREINAGRCDFGEDEGCVCSDPVIKPGGTVKGCGCDDAPTLGNINDPDFALPEYWQQGECSHDQDEEQ